MKNANHPSTIAIKHLNNTLIFGFSNRSVGDVKKEIRKLDPRKATQNTDIPVDKGLFQSVLENAKITPAFKKVFRGSKENYRLASILPIISKISEKLLQNK